VVNNLDASIRSIAPMQAEIELQNAVSKETVISAIESVGYTVNK
jgi:hypothetical protein